MDRGVGSNDWHPGGPDQPAEPLVEEHEIDPGSKESHGSVRCSPCPAGSTLSGLFTRSHGSVNPASRSSG